MKHRCYLSWFVGLVTISFLLPGTSARASSDGLDQPAAYQDSAHTVFAEFATSTW